MAFPSNPSVGQLYSIRGEVWRYSTNVWNLYRKYPSTIIKVLKANGINQASGWWQSAKTELRKPIAPGKPAHCVVNMYNKTGGTTDIGVPGHAKFTYYLFDWQGNQIFTSNYILNTMDSYPINQFRTGLHFNFPVVLPANKVPAKSIRFRCDWNIKQQQSGAWHQWEWVYQVTSA